ncbi:MAG: hypothetical protein IJT88_01990 [Kiritimatiellae bacterium]|nr:hypothetical protein [Kiritimatiellia bacterium]
MKITSIENGDTMTVKLNRRESTILRRIADAMNTLEEGHTPASVFADFIMAAPEDMMRNAYDVADYILADVAEECEPDMRRAFIRAGLWGEAAFAERSAQ